ncbi:MAG: glycosyltransferase family 2 protein [Desulfobulbaceae bacterium]|nr:glycosyltransferase family 2 protein [Desulfobulbaceae bacterium]
MLPAKSNPRHSESLKVLVSIFAFNEGRKLEVTVRRFPNPRNYDVMVMDDGSTDGTRDMLRRHPSILVLRNNENVGVGYGMRRVFRYALENSYDVVVPYAGNNKDRPDDIPVLLEAIRNGHDFVQGSRYKKGGMYGNMPFYRQLATRFVHPWIFSLVAGSHITDSTNGFRAIRTTLFKDKQIDLDQEWLDRYELEPYLFLKAIKLGYRVTEVPVTKIYPEKGLGKYTKMKPVWGWWSILRPLIFVWFKMKE